MKTQVCEECDGDIMHSPHWHVGCGVCNHTEEILKSTATPEAIAADNAKRGAPMGGYLIRKSVPKRCPNCNNKDCYGWIDSETNEEGGVR